VSLNALRWDGSTGHYEVYYLSATDQRSATGLWIRYTLLAPLQGPAQCSLWFMAMDRRGLRVGRKASFPISELSAADDPFRLTLAGADLSDRGMAGGLGAVAWELSWEPSARGAEHVHPLVRRARIARTILVLPHPDLDVRGRVTIDGRTLELDGARGSQAHLWGSQHAARWAWAHAGDLRGAPDGEPRHGDWLDAVSVYVPRLGREVGPSTAVVASLGGEEFRATGPVAVARAASRFGLTGWDFEARDGARRVIGEVAAPRASLVGVTYHDPDGAPAYCYNSEVASMRLSVLDRRARGRFGWVLRDTLVADGLAHFEYAQRTPVAGIPLLVH
jgi:hypothetical protein